MLLGTLTLDSPRGHTQLFKANRPFHLSVFQCWSRFSPGPKRLTFEFQVQTGQLSISLDFTHLRGWAFGLVQLSGSEADGGGEGHREQGGSCVGRRVAPCLRKGPKTQGFSVWEKNYVWEGYLGSNRSKSEGRVKIAVLTT